MLNFSFLGLFDGYRGNSVGILYPAHMEQQRLKRAEIVQFGGGKESGFPL